MRTALRLAVCVALAAASAPAFGRSPASNGCGDGEANVPFATAVEAAIGAEEIGGGSGEPGRVEVAYPAFARSPMSNGAGDGEANVPFAALPMTGAEEIGGGSGEPGRAEAGAMDEAARAEAAREFERHVWTDP